MLDAQKKELIIYDIKTQTIDTIPPIQDFDSTLISSQTPFFTGLLTEGVANLVIDIPNENTGNSANYTIKNGAAEDLNLLEFPVSVAVKLFQEDREPLGGFCSGTMISRKHVLTAAHCLSKMDDRQPLFNKIKVTPVFDQGEVNLVFPNAYASKFYYFNNWRAISSDIGLIELEENIGDYTGWVSIGYTQDDQELLDGFYYKFSYPSITLTNLDSNKYNGDTLYYNYGKIDYINDKSIGVKHATGIPGESGSSLISVIPNEEYKAIGALSISYAVQHTRIRNWIYYSFLPYLQNSLSIPSTPTGDEILVYPNPTSDQLYIRMAQGRLVDEIILQDIKGRIVQNYPPLSSSRIDLSEMAAGLYFLVVTSGENKTIKKIVKTNL